jgi:hypothetical protein
MHLDLTSSGLTELIIYEITKSMRRAKSLLAIHLSGNPGLTYKNQDFIFERLKLRPVEEMDRF